MLTRISRRRRSGSLGWLVPVVLAAAAATVLPYGGRGIEGYARVIDGDSIRLGDREIRLKGVDAPEMRQTCLRAGRAYRCGEAARQAVAARVEGRPVACRIEGRDRYGRSLARCRVDGEDLGAWLVREGIAVGYRDYEAEEAAARARGVGLWSGEFERPSLWRQEHTRS